MSIILNSIKLIGVLIIAAYGSTLGLIVLLFTFNTDKCINIAVGTFSRSLFFWCGVKLKTYGNLNVEKSPGKIYVSNHESHFDPPALALACPHPLYFIAKKELKYVPFIGWYIWLSGMIFIDRKSKSKAQASIKKASEQVKNGKNIISFSEGTRTKTGELMIFKRGAFKMAKENNLEIVPLAVSGSREVLASGSWHIKPGLIKVMIGDVIRAEEFKDLSVEELAAETRSRVERMRKELKQLSQK